MEILAPAGSPQAVIAAVQNGANAVYLGQQDFNARSSAQNFDEEALRQAVLYCHARGVAVHQTLNTVLFDSQLEDFCECVKTACRCQVDAFIVQDLAAAQIASKICPSMPLHASTQMTIHTPAGAQMAEKMGFSRVILARELSCEQIEEIVKSVAIETEVFVHGALCMSVSGQCYMSAMIGTRSANRGNCAGTCRLPFTTNKEEAYDLSLKDFCLVEHLQKLQEIGVTSLKIEGRMKRPEYVAAAAKAYSNALRGLPVDQEQLRSVFSRSGFTDGYFTDQRGAQMFGTRQKEDVTAADSAILKTLQATYAKEGDFTGISFELTVRKDEPISLTATDEQGNTAMAVGEIPQMAIQRALSEQAAQQSLAKLGGTIFAWKGAQIEIEEGVTVPLSALNALRREVCQALLSQRANNSRYEKPIETQGIAIAAVPAHSRGAKLRLRLRSLSQLDFALLEEVEFVILPIDEVLNAKELLVYQSKVIIEPDRVLFGSESRTQEKLEKLYALGYRQMMVSNLSHLQLGKAIGYSMIADCFVNCTNSLAAQMWAEQGIAQLTLSAELMLAKAVHISSPIPTGIIGYGHFPLMITRNCPIQNQIRCSECKGNRCLTDRTGTTFPVICQRGQYSEILNNVPIYLADKPEWKEFDFVTLYFTIESKETCREIVSRYQQQLPCDGKFTRGLAYRGII